MFDIGIQEILVILVIALIFIGPKRLPEVASTLGKGFGEFKKALDGLKESATTDLRDALEKEDLLKKYPHLAEAEKAAAAARVEEKPSTSPYPEAEEPSGEAATAGKPAHGTEKEPVLSAAEPAAPKLSEDDLKSVTHSPEGIES